MLWYPHHRKMKRLEAVGLKLSRNDSKIILFGQLLTTIRAAEETRSIAALVEQELSALDAEKTALTRMAS